MTISESFSLLCHPFNDHKHDRIKGQDAVFYVLLPVTLTCGFCRALLTSGLGSPWARSP